MTDTTVELDTATTLSDEVVDKLRTEPLSAVLREATWGSHDKAEHGDFEQALVHGRMRKEAYAMLAAQTYFIYSTIEELSEALADDPIASRVQFPELLRTAKIERDLAYYYGENWRDEIVELPSTKAYTARIRKAAAEHPAGYVAHNYTRYLADLSGGFVIDRAIQKAYDLDEDGRHFYIFDIEDPKAFKANYRSILDDLDLDLEGKIRLIEEALVAYNANINLNDEVAAQFDSYTID